MKIAIIGSGISGLAAARTLNKIADITIFEKSRGIGGRIATRRAKPFTSDQIKFLKYFKTIKSKPPNRHSKQYSQLKETQKTLIRYYYIRNYKKRNMLKFEKR